MSNFSDLKTKLEEFKDIGAALSLMSWDQEVMMPAGGIAFRARQMGTMSGMQHHKLVSEIGPILSKIKEEGETNLSDFEKQNLRKITWEYERQSKIPVELVVEMTRACAEAQHAWEEAKTKSDFNIFEPFLSNLLRLKLKEADYLGFEKNPYNAHLETFEPGITVEILNPLFEKVKAELIPILNRIKNAKQVENTFLQQPIPESNQISFSEDVLRKMGFDFNRGRQDLSSHPFTINFSPDDVRITTRIEPDGIANMLYSSIHEGGHALYEQGMSPEHYGLPVSEYCSIGMHESQSRIWENNVGRSLEFWQYFFEPFSKLFPDQLKGKTPEDVFKAVNRVEPSLIRVSADELTYHFHIIVRFELENELLNGQLKVKDLPAAWNEKIKKYLGLEVKNDREGVLQDIHWAHGTFGYFPTYSIGSFYAAQFMAKALEELPALENQFIKGEFSAFLQWLREKVHSRGALFSSEKLCEIITGEPLNVKFFIDYATKKFAQVYSI